MAEAFGIGDIVRVKSGGPDMVVESLEANPAAVQHPHSAERLVRCLWVGSDGAVQTYAFWPHMLVGVKEDKDTVAAKEAKAKADKEKTDRERAENRPAPLAPGQVPDNRVVA